MSFKLLERSLLWTLSASSGYPEMCKFTGLKLRQLNRVAKRFVIAVEHESKSGSSLGWF